MPDWIIDLEQTTATHEESGLVVRYDADPETPGAWNGKPEEGHAGEIFERLKATHGPDEAVNIMARLMREAGDAYAAALGK